MRGLLAFCVGLLALAPVSSGAEDDTKKQAELKWARGVADDLLAALRKQDYDNAAALLTADYAKILQGQGTLSAVQETLRHRLPPGIEKVTIADEMMSPDRDEAQFKGQVERSAETQAFAVRVVKEKESGRWRVGFFHTDEARAKAKEPRK